MSKLNLTNSWTALEVTTGTIQNISNKNVPIEVSDEETASTGQVLYPKDAMSFSGVQLYARTTLNNTTAEVRVSPFADAVGSSGSSSSGGTTYVLPTASSSIKGGIKVGSYLKMSGDILSADTGTTAGKLVEVGTNGKIDTSIVPTTYTLPTATASVKGGVEVGDGLKMSGDVMSVDTGTTAGKVVAVNSAGKIDASLIPAVNLDDTFVVDSESAMLALSATQGDVCVRTDLVESYILQSEPASTLSNWVLLESPTSGVTSVNGKTGTVVIDVPTKVSQLTNDAGYITSAPTKTSQLTNDSGFVTSVPTKVSQLTNDSGFISKIPTATKTVLGAIKVGSNLSISSDGTLSADTQTSTQVTVWESGKSYNANDLVKVGDNLFMCLVAHTSSDWDTELALDYWQQIDSDVTAIDVSTGYAQITKMNVTAPTTVNAVINFSDTLCKPPIEVLAHDASSAAVSQTVNTFDYSEASDFDYDSEAVVLDGKMYPKTEFEYTMSLEESVEDSDGTTQYIKITDSYINLEDYKSISEVLFQ